MPGFGKHFLSPSATSHRVKVFSAQPSFTLGVDRGFALIFIQEKRGKAMVAKRQKWINFQRTGLRPTLNSNTDRSVFLKFIVQTTRLLV